MKSMSKLPYIHPMYMVLVSPAYSMLLILSLKFPYTVHVRNRSATSLQVPFKIHLASTHPTHCMCPRSALKPPMAIGTPTAGAQCPCKHCLYTDDQFPTHSDFTHILICTSICMLGACHTFLIHPDLTLIYTRVNSRSAVSLQAPSEQGRPVSYTFRLLTHTRT